MSPNTITTIGAAVGLFIALWTMVAHFEKRNQDRFDGLDKRFDALEKHLDQQITAAKEVLRAEMKEMRAEIRLEIREAADRRISK